MVKDDGFLITLKRCLRSEKEGQDGCREKRCLPRRGTSLIMGQPSPLSRSVDRCRPLLKVFGSMISYCTAVCGIVTDGPCAPLLGTIA